MSGDHNRYQKPDYVDRRQWKYDPMTGEPLVDGWPLYSGLPEPEPYPNDFIDALRYHTAISEQPEQEPVAHLWECLGRWSAMIAHDGEHADLSPPSWLCDAIKAATAPPQREWQGLTNEEIKATWSQIWYDLGNGKFAASDDPSRHTTVMFARAIEAKLKEKNSA